MKHQHIVCVLVEKITNVYTCCKYIQYLEPVVFRDHGKRMELTESAFWNGISDYARYSN